MATADSPQRRPRKNLTIRDVTRIRELRYQDGLSAPAVAGIIGCSEQTVLHYAPGRPGKIPNDNLRELFHRSGLNANEVAWRMGWVYTSEGRVKANGALVKRALGLSPDIGVAGRRTARSLIDAGTAEELAEAMGFERWQVLPDEEVAA